MLIDFIANRKKLFKKARPFQYTKHHKSTKRKQVFVVSQKIPRLNQIVISLSEMNPLRINCVSQSSHMTRWHFNRTHSTSLMTRWFTSQTLRRMRQTTCVSQLISHDKMTLQSHSPTLHFMTRWCREHYQPNIMLYVTTHTHTQHARDHA